MQNLWILLPPRRRIHQLEATFRGAYSSRQDCGTPEGCAGLDEAIEGLKLCDIVNDTVVSDLGV